MRKKAGSFLLLWKILLGGFSPCLGKGNPTPKANGSMMERQACILAILFDRVRSDFSHKTNIPVYLITWITRGLPLPAFPGVPAMKMLRPSLSPVERRSPGTCVRDEEIWTLTFSWFPEGRPPPRVFKVAFALLTFNCPLTSRRYQLSLT